MEQHTGTRLSDGWTAQPGRASKRKPVNIASKLDRRKAKPSTFSKFKVINKGLAIGWRMNRSGVGTWTARRMGNNGKYDPLHVIGSSDEASASDGITVFSYDEAVTAAIAWNKQREAEESGHIVATGSYTVKDAVEDYLKDKEAEKRKNLYRDRATANAHIYPTLGSVELRKLTHGRVRAWHQALATAAPRARTKAGKPQRERKYDPNNPNALQARQSTANRVLTVLKAALNHSKAQTRRIGSDAAWVDVKPFKDADRKKDRFLTLDEIKSLVPACEADFAKLVKGALYTGARYGELTRIRVEHFSESDSNVFIDKSKNGLARHVYLNPDAVAFFKAITEGRNAKEHIFLKDGRAWNQSEQKRPMDEATEAAKIEGVTFHTLRHSYASQARMAGMPLDVLKEQLGHADLRMTMRYAKIGKSHQQQQVMQYAPVFTFAPTNSASA